MTSRLIVVSGLPGTGKSAIAEAIGTQLDVPVFAKDWLEAPLRDVIDREQLGSVGYDLLTTLARRQLMLGQSVILDSVASTDAIRALWTELAHTYGASLRAIECVCSDEAAHRERLSKRERGIPGWPELEWSEVERVRGYFAPWTTDRLVLDAADPLDANVARAIAYVA